jgi:hypothetical protein
MHVPATLSPILRRVLAQDRGKASNAVRKKRMAANTLDAAWPQLGALLLADAVKLVTHSRTELLKGMTDSCLSTLSKYATGNEERNLAELYRLGIFELSERTAITLAQMLTALLDASDSAPDSAALFGARGLAGCARPDELAAMMRRFAEVDIESGGEEEEDEAAAAATVAEVATPGGAGAGPSAAAGGSQDGEGEAVFDPIVASAASSEARCGNCGCPESETPKMTLTGGVPLCNLCNKHQRDKGTPRPTALEKKRKDSILRRVETRDKRLGEKRARNTGAAPLTPGGGGGGLLWRVRLRSQPQLGSVTTGDDRRTSLRLRPAAKN